MNELDAITKKWGDSIAIIIPKDIVKAEKIKPNEKIHVTVHKEVDLSDLFGKFKTKKTAQQLKDEARKGWD
jgi:antitoxin component of MazEF toxin-antitoxin module